MADEEREHRAKLRKEYTRRKRLLEIRKARLGDAADPALDIDLEEINASLRLLDMADAPKAKPEVRDAIGSDSILDLVVAQVGKFGERLTGMEEQGARTEERMTGVEQKVAAVEEQGKRTAAAVAEAQHDDHVWRAQHRTAHDTSDHDRAWGQMRNFWLTIVALILIAALFVVVLGGR